MKDEVVQGIRNALERGDTLETAAQSFINAGYDADDVHAAAASIQNPAMPIISPASASTQRPQLPKLQPYSGKQNKGSGIGKVILLIVVLVILLGILGAILFFKDKILALFGL